MNERTIPKTDYTLEKGKCQALYKHGYKACYECIHSDCKNTYTAVTKDESNILDMLETYIKKVR